MVYIARSLVSGKIGLLVTRYGRLFLELLDGFPSEPFKFGLQYFCKFPLFPHLLKSHLSGRLTSSIDTVIYTDVYLEDNLIQILVNWLLYLHCVCLWEQRLVLRLILEGSRFPYLGVYKVMVFTRSLLHKVLIGDDILWLYDVQSIHTKLLDKLYNLLVLLNLPNMESGIRSIFKYVSDLD